METLAVKRNGRRRSTSRETRPSTGIHRSQSLLMASRPANKKESSIGNKPMIPVGSMPYLNFRVSVYFQHDDDGMKRFFYEPIALLDPSSVSSRQDRVEFRVQMWNQEVEAKLADYLQRLSIHQLPADSAYNIQVMPYDQVRLIVKKKKAPESVVSYLQLNQSLPFHLDCQSEQEADRLVGRIKQDAEYWARDLAVECRSSDRLTVFDINTKEPTIAKGLPDESDIVQHRLKGNF